MDIEDNQQYQESDGLKYLIVSVFFAILSFFILINVISSENEQKKAKVVDAVKQEFKNKKIEDELELFAKRRYDRKIGEYSRSFRDVLTTFMDISRRTVNTELVESTTYYVLKTKIATFFGIRNNNPRAQTIGFITSLNNFLIPNRKIQTAQAKVLLYYVEGDLDSYENTLEKMKSMQKALKDTRIKTLNFSMMPAKATETDKIANIRIIFDKNEF